MCGIAGMIGFQTNTRILTTMLDTMKRRGPDGSGIFEDGDCTLLHSRLAIIDPENGRQPMTLVWGREEYTITYNGELYNAKELKVELLRLGHKFSTNCDTEVLLHAYAQWKTQCLERLNGIYAFGIWEKYEQKLFLARDRMGVKPLFYTLKDDGLLFASELKTILAHPQIMPQLDRDGVSQVLLLGPSRCPGSGVFKNMEEMKPGYYGIYANNRFTVSCYWRVTDGEHRICFDETVEEVRFLVKDAIQRQLFSHVPIGTFLSGGLDSSIISSICANAMSEKGEVLPTFSLDYQGNDLHFVPGKFQPTADAAFIKEMKRYIRSDHFDTIIDTQDLVLALEDATRARDLPGMADVDSSLLLFCKDIRAKVKVALSGECADEIFGGYPWYRDPQVREQQGFPWAQNLGNRSLLLHPDMKAGFDGFEYVHSLYRQTIDSADILQESNDLERRMKQMVILNQNWFMQTLLDRKDRMSMYCGLEVRVPFCDHRIAEYMYRVPWEYKDWQGREKGLLRKAMEGVLPDAVLWRKKSPYPKTFDPQYEICVRKLFDEMCEDANAPIYQIVDADALKSIPERQLTTPWYGQLMRLPQTMAYMLQINQWLKEYKIQVLI